MLMQKLTLHFFCSSTEAKNLTIYLEMLRSTFKSNAAVQKRCFRKNWV